MTRDGQDRTDILAVKTTGDRQMIEAQVKAARGLASPVNCPLGVKSQSHGSSTCIGLLGPASHPGSGARPFRCRATTVITLPAT